MLDSACFVARVYCLVFAHLTSYGMIVLCIQILLGVGGCNRKWKAIVAHATTCTTGDGRMHYDDDQRMFSHKSSNEPQMIVVYNFVGKLKGVINESHFVPIDNLPADDKVSFSENKLCLCY